MPHLAPDFAYAPVLDFYELPHFQAAYDKLATATDGFRDVTAEHLTAVIQADPTVLLPLRTMTGLLRKEFAWTTKLIAEPGAVHRARNPVHPYRVAQPGRDNGKV